MMRRRGLLGFLLAAAALTGLPAAGSAVEEQSLLAADGTLHVVRAGLAVDLGVPDALPHDYAIDWTSRSQDGSVATALIPGTASAGIKRNLQLAFDEQTQALLVLWTEVMFPHSEVRIGVLHDGTWLNSGFLPNQGLSGAYNPRMILTHQSVTHLDEHDSPVTTTSSILSVIWWEDAQYGQARYGTLFLDENGFDPASLEVYDLPALLGGGGETPYDDIPSGSYLFPSLEADGLSGAVVASFADLHAQRHKVVRISFPEDQGKPSETGNLKWQRRHIPIMGVAREGRIARKTPKVATNAPRELAVGTSIGAGYKPTLYWLDGDALKFLRLGESDWEPVRAIPIDESMTYDRALSLVVGMGKRN